MITASCDHDCGIASGVKVNTPTPTPPLSSPCSCYKRPPKISRLLTSSWRATGPEATGSLGGNMVGIQETLTMTGRLMHWPSPTPFQLHAYPPLSSAGMLPLLSPLLQMCNVHLTWAWLQGPPSSCMKSPDAFTIIDHGRNMDMYPGGNVSPTPFQLHA